MNLKAKRAAALKAAQDIIAAAKAADRDLTPEEVADIEAKTAEIKSLDAQIEQAAKSAAAMDAVLGMATQDDLGDEGPVAGRAKSLGEHFVKSVGAERLGRAKGVSGATVSATEYKAATDTTMTGGAEGALAPLLIEVDTTIVKREPDELTPVASLLGQGRITVGSAIQYFVESPVQGDVDNVAEGGNKPQLHVANPTPEIAALKKIAGWTTVTDEYFEDLPLLASEIDGRLVRRLARRIEQQVLLGTGTGAQLPGLLNAAGVQVINNVAAGNYLAWADAILEATALVEDNSGEGLLADAVVMNRTSYVALRKLKDGNSQYYGGGFFQGQYGNGAIVDGSTLWGGLRIAISPFVPAGVGLVGAFKDAATLYGKGGVSVDMSNSHADNFTTNKVTLRAEVRKALAVRHPAGFCKVSFAA